MKLSVKLSAHIFCKTTVGQGTFVMKSIADMIGIGGTPTSVTINTLNGNVTSYLVAVESLKVWAMVSKGENRLVKKKQKQFHRINFKQMQRDCFTRKKR